MILVFACSPHNGGASDLLAQSAVAGAADQDASLIKLSRFAISGCSGCGACLRTGECALPPDGAENLYASLFAAHAAIFVSPIYFYALPGQFKLFIDRSQKFWARLLPDGKPPKARKQAGIILIAGRHAGEKLFAGALLTLKWFLMPFGYAIGSKELWRGIDKASDLQAWQMKRAREMGAELAGGL